MLGYNTSHIIKRTGKMIDTDRSNAFSGLQFDTSGAKIQYFHKPGQNCVPEKAHGSQKMFCQKSSGRF